MKSVHTIPSYIFKIHFNIIHPLIPEKWLIFDLENHNRSFHCYKSSKLSYTTGILFPIRSFVGYAHDVYEANKYGVVVTGAVPPIHAS
jgi:hypothetical protein